ncbi:hypothetical protein KUTeg_023245 [Tegillarca granosa]|uniref:GPI mannosyltransferase 2 n=1 Tax=Tegillarca granosa TaxID=220873 RepID=A0ABQ9E6U7_TEGGR|nr:hypothetical protein KUTeg_023245 [Tegillarca granosa]
MAAFDLELKITQYALQSRYIILMIQMHNGLDTYFVIKIPLLTPVQWKLHYLINLYTDPLIISNAIIPDHDAGAFNPPRSKDEQVFILDKFISITLGGFVRWDGVYFLHISEYGYTYDNCLAFFPLFPFLVRFISCTILFPLHYIMTYRSVIIISAYLFNQYIFIKSAVLVYRLGKKVLGNEVISYKAALLFCMNPASIFMSAPYSETLFSFLTFSSMLQFEQNQFWSACSIGLSFITRSNGIITAGFKLHMKVTEFLRQLITMKKIHCKDKISGSIPTHLSVYGQQKGYKIINGRISPWCNYSIPIPYGYVQSEIWNVGFLKYYQFRQIPNFLLAIPVTILSIFITLGLLPNDTDYKKSDRQESATTRDVLQSRRLLPYIFHLMFYVIFCWLFIHIQVMTRMVFSSSPVLYWYAAYIMTTEACEQPRQNYNKWDVSGFQSETHKVETKYNLQHNIRNILTGPNFQFPLPESSD